MSDVVVTISAGDFAATNSRSFSASLSRPSSDVLILGTILAIMQVLDGLLTASGVAMYGLRAEANLLIRLAMEQLGTVPALVLLKGVAILIVALLCSLAATVPWVPRALKIMIVIYLVGAIIPWSWIHLSRFV